MRPGALLAGSPALFAAIAACTSQDRPPAEGDCVPTDGGTCSPTIVTGGSSGGSDGGSAGACTVSSGDSACDQCESMSCCTQLQSCNNLPACENLLSCENNCNDVGSCITACQQEFPTGVLTLQVLASCVTRDCLVCSESGVGDPCDTIYPPCVAGLTCNGSYCTKACARSTDCAGLGAGGVSSLGFASVCMSTTAGDLCVPGCGPAGACSDFSSTYCLSTTALDGTAVSVCAFLPEASTTDSSTTD
jgi:hypothetical protein